MLITFFIKFLVLLVLLISCGDLPDEGTLKRSETSVTITYTHPPIHEYEVTRYNKSTRALIDNAKPFRHNIKVEPDIADIDLDEDLRAEVEVPVDKPMYVEYTNWLNENPNIYFQYGKSDEFIVTWESDYVVKVWIDVDINPDYPFQKKRKKRRRKRKKRKKQQITKQQTTKLKL